MPMRNADAQLGFYGSQVHIKRAAGVAGAGVVGR
jgi:hypothetical protein